MDIGSLILTILTIIASSVAVYEKVHRVIEKQQRKKEKEFIEKVEDIIEEKLEPQTQLILKEVEKNYISIQDDAECHREISKKLLKMEYSIEKLHDKNDKRDAKFIRQEIIQFSDNLKNGNIPSDLAYKNILEFYDYYKNILHENSYIDEEIAFIRGEMAKYVK
jgi:Zn-dependent metalloprotease